MSQGFPLSAAQKRLWASPLPTAAVLIELAGEVDAGRLRGAFDALVARHEALRTRLVPVAGLKVPVQVVDDGGSLAWSEDDLAGCDEEERRRRLDDLFAAAAGAVLDPGQGPQLHARWVLLGAGRSALALTSPALAADAAALERLAADLAALYAGRGGELPEPLQYLDIAEWQRERAAATDEEALQSQAYWQRRRADGAARGLEAPFALPAGAAHRPAVSALPAAAGTALGRLAAGLGVPARDLARAAWWILWGRLAGRPGLTVREAVDGRDDAELATGVGPIGGWVPLSDEIAPGETVAALARRLARAAAEAGRFRLYAGDEEAEEGRAAVGFAWRTPAILSDAGVTWTVARLQVADPGLALALAGLEHGTGIDLELAFDAGRVEAGEVAALGERFTDLLAELDPEAPVARLSAVGRAGQERLLAAWGRGEELAVPDVRIHRLFERAARATPAAPAVAAAGRTLSYAELDLASNLLGRRLRQLGVGPDVPVALYLPRSPELVVGLLAILKAGGACLPFDTSQPPRRLALMLEEVAAPVVVTVEALAASLPPGLPARVLCLDREAADLFASGDGSPLTGDPPPEALAYLIFTSGSTGRPKGVAVEHRQLESYVAGVAKRLELPPGGAYASVSTLAADLGHTAIFPALTGGGCLHLIAEEDAADAEAVARYFEQHPIDVLKIVPTHWEALAAGLANPARLLPRARLVLGGEATPRSLAGELIRRLGEAAPGCRLFNHYGPTETTVGVLTFPAAGGLDPRAATLPIGHPLPNAAVYVLDAAGRPSPAWEPGDVWIGGPQVARGYHGNPDLTADRFRPDPWGTGGRLYRAGDVARHLPGGAIEFLGRRDSQVKFHGFRVELGEIRAALCAHRDIRDAVARLCRDPTAGEVLVAYYVARQEIPVAELRAQVAATLLEEVIPNLFVHLRKLPLTLNGKVNLAALPSLEEARQRAAREFVPPAGETEIRVAEIWSQVLAVSPISADADFFELGGHSLLATRIVARLREAFGVELSLRVMFETPTVAGLARLIEAGLAPAAAAPAPAAAEPSLEDQLAALEAMSDDEAAALLEGGQTP